MTPRGSAVRQARELARIGEAFVRLDVKQEFAYPLTVVFRYIGLLLPVVIQFFIAKLVPTEAGSIGSDYFTFSVVGLTVAGALQMTMEKFGSRLQAYQDQGVLETLLIEPVPWTFVPVAMNLYHLGAAALAVAATLGLGIVLGAELVLAGLLPFLGIVGLAALAGTAIGILSASVLVLAKRSSPVVRLYGLAASLVGGAVFPIDLLPDWLRAVSYLVPHAYAISAAREAIMATPPGDPAIGVSVSVVALLVFVAVVLPVGLWLFRRSLAIARRQGMLGTY